MTDNGVGVVLVFVEEVVYAREGNLIDVLVDLFFCHADTPVADGECTFFTIQFYLYG